MALYTALVLFNSESAGVTDIKAINAAQGRIQEALNFQVLFLFMLLPCIDKVVAYAVALHQNSLNLKKFLRLLCNAILTYYSRHSIH